MLSDERIRQIAAEHYGTEATEQDIAAIRAALAEAAQQTRPADMLSVSDAAITASRGDGELTVVVGRVCVPYDKQNGSDIRDVRSALDLQADIDAEAAQVPVMGGSGFDSDFIAEAKRVAESLRANGHYLAHGIITALLSSWQTEKAATSITQAELCRIAQLMKAERYDDANDALLSVISAIAKERQP